MGSGEKKDFFAGEAKCKVNAGLDLYTATAQYRRVEPIILVNKTLC